MSAPKFRWASPRFEAIAPAKQFGPWLLRLPDRSPDAIVDAARDPKSPAHRLFGNLWDPSVAARMALLSHARLLLASFCIETSIRTTRGKTKIVNVPVVSRSGPGEYGVTLEALKVSEKRDFMLRNALAEASRWRRRYANLSELALVFQALDETESRVTRRRKKA